jgi:hypothetical protein
LLLGLFGCLDYGTHYDVNACSGLATERCATLHLTGETAIATAELTQVALWVHYTSSGSERVSPVSTTVKAPTPLPIAVGLHLPLQLDFGADVSVLALNGPGIVGYKRVSADPSIGNNDDVDVQLQRPQVSGCFDNIFSSSNETDVDCGNNCPPCASGRHCNSGSDCQSAACAFDSTASQFLCQ